MALPAVTSVVKKIDPDNLFRVGNFNYCNDECSKAPQSSKVKDGVRRSKDKTAQRNLSLPAIAIPLVTQMIKKKQEIKAFIDNNKLLKINLIDSDNQSFIDTANTYGPWNKEEERKNIGRQHTGENLVIF